MKISYCHPGVFVPVYADDGEYSFNTSSGLSIAYWDEHAYASEWTQHGRESISMIRLHLTTAPKDEEMTKLYNELKAVETLHANTAATITQGT